MHGGFRWTAATVRSERIRAIIPNGRWLTAFASERPAVVCQCHGVLARVLARELVEAVERIVHLDVPHLREAGLADQLPAAGLLAVLAARFYLSKATVKSHIVRILAKLGLRDRVQIAVHRGGGRSAQERARGRAHRRRETRRAVRRDVRRATLRDPNISCPPICRAGPGHRLFAAAAVSNS